MSIRFSCPSCSQPIEIDDEWASKLVACPFCRNTITAPAESTLAVDEAVPVADALSVPEVVVGQPSLAPASLPYPAADGRRNTLAIVSFVASIGAFVVYFAANALFLFHAEEMFGGLPVGMDATQTSEALLRYIEAQGGPPTWLLGFMLLLLVAGLSWLTAVVCGGIALTRREHRGFAIAGLGISGFMMLMICLSSVSNFV